MASIFYNNGYLRERRLEMMHRGEFSNFFILFKKLEEKNAHDLERLFKNNKTLLLHLGNTPAWQVSECRKLGFIN